jgi:hypothetical protein
MVVFDAFPRTHRLERVEHRFEFAHDDHVMEYCAQAFVAETRTLDIDVARVLIEGDFGNLQCSAFADLAWFNRQ